MKNLDINHVLFWMDAIRNSNNPMRTLESFWKGQVNSKIWLIDQLKPFVTEPVSIDIFGGWNGVLASLLFQSDVPVKSIRNIDIDPLCEHVAYTMNKLEEINGTFRHVTMDMTTIRSDSDVAINTSCEHITQDQYDLWLSGLPQNSLIVLQSNNLIIDEHINCSQSLEEFKQKADIDCFFSGELELSKYTRYLLIGKKHGHNNQNIS